MNMFEEIKGKVSTLDAARYYGLRIFRGGKVCCPFHNDRHPSMKVDRGFYCFGCGAHGDVIDFVQRMFSLSAGDPAFKLIEDFHLSLNIDKDPRGKPKESKKERDARLRIARRKEYEEKIRTAYAEEIRKFRLQLAGISRTFHNWEVSFLPVRDDWDNDRIDKRYAAALHDRDRIEYIIGILDDGSDDEIYEEFKHRKEIIENYERKNTELDR